MLDFVQRYRAHPSITKCGVDSNHALTPMKCDVPVICNVMHHYKSMSCHICNECHINNINHTLCHVSWTIILHAYNFQNKHSFQCQAISILMSTFIKQQLSSMYHQSNNNTFNPQGQLWHIYNAHKKKLTQTALKLATKSAKQALNSLNYCFFIQAVPEYFKGPITHNHQTIHKADHNQVVKQPLKLL